MNVQQNWELPLFHNTLSTGIMLHRTAVKFQATMVKKIQCLQHKVVRLTNAMTDKSHIITF